MVGVTHSIRLVFLALAAFMFFAGNMAQADQSAKVQPRLVEVFTTTDLAVTDTTAINHQPGYRGIKLHVYKLDVIQRFEAQLSSNLPADPKKARQIALQRIQQLDERETASIQQAAGGLAKAMQYGVNRYPAIVFNGKAVVYGLTDMSAAFDYYRTWQAGARP